MKSIILLLLLILFFSGCYTKFEIVERDNINLCEQYINLDKVEMKFEKGEKLILINNTYFKETQIKEDCLNRKS